MSIDAATIEVDALWVAARVAAATSGGDLDLLKQPWRRSSRASSSKGFAADSIPLFEAWLVGERQRFRDFIRAICRGSSGSCPRPVRRAPTFNEAARLAALSRSGASGFACRACGLWAHRRRRGPSGGGDPSIQESRTELSPAREGLAGAAAGGGQRNATGILAPACRSAGRRCVKGQRSASSHHRSEGDSAAPIDCRAALRQHQRRSRTGVLRRRRH